MIANAILLVTFVFILYVEGPFQPFWIWNALPIGLTAAFLAYVRRRGASLVPTTAFGVGAVGTTLYVHVAWLFDWDQLASGSSTAGIIFIVLPIMALGAGVALYAIARLVLWLRRH